MGASSETGAASDPARLQTFEDWLRTSKAMVEKALTLLETLVSRPD